MINKLRPKSEFSRNVLTLMTGTTIAQAIPIAIAPILTRIYTPEDFGVFALYMSVASLVSVMATGRYELAIMLPKKDADAANIVILSIGITTIVSLFSFIIILLFNQPMSQLLGDPKIANLLYFIPLSVLATGVYQSFYYWHNRKKQYQYLAANKVIQSTAASFTQVGMGSGGLSSSGLIFGTLAGQSIAAYGLSRQTVKQHRNLFSCISKMKIIALSRKYKKLPLFNLPNAFIDGLRLSGINILIAHIFTSAVLGQFSLAWRMVQAPMSLIGRSLSHVFFQKLSTAPRSQLHHIIKTFLFKAILLALPIFLMVYFFSEAIFILVFGEQWKIAGEAASIMAPWLFLNFLTSPVSTVFIVLDRQEAALGFAVVFMLTPLLILSFFSHLDFLSLLSMVSLAMSSLLLIFIGIVFYVIRQEKQKIL